MPEYYKQITTNASMFDYESFYATVAAELPNDSHLVEIGSASGRSAIFLAEALREQGKRFQLLMVDDLSYGGREQFDEIVEHLKAAHLFGSVSLLAADSLIAARDVVDGSKDFVFIDGSHEYPAVLADIRLWRHKVKGGGWLAGHDLKVDGVRMAVDREFGSEFGSPVCRVPTRDGWDVWSVRPYLHDRR